ncbi:hypothetical protein CSB45_00685 [candidate division KSB3 bacterium]|uniref:DUF4126 domain-containing protein n=1 Tax=candidate division KSB3 bacterium TaxID=2044937 RepID=A0A2G6ED56_9BACT|nr:MAG: hypothetical protein CSB45_00685 [candidate division KSB3 bacterium]PIE31026.1 MAG: hypothetical protein CSA57_01535 [candidate division KSB3 bacterium]
MKDYNQLIQTLSLAMGASWAGGINLYATIVMLGGLGMVGAIRLPDGLQMLTHPAVIGAAAIMYIVEFFADKIPVVDNTWDAVHTFIRIPLSALLAAGAVGDVSPALSIAAGLLGGGIAASTHSAKAGTRMLLNVSPEPFTNIAASLTEDVAVVAGLWTALHYPLIFILLFIIFLLLLLWLLPNIWRGVKKIVDMFRRFFGGRPSTSDAGSS